MTERSIYMSIPAKSLLLKISVIVAVCFLFSVFSCSAQEQELPYEPIITVKDQIPADAEENFKALLEKFQKRERIPNLDGEIRYYGDYSSEYSTYDSIHWDNFIQADRFVFSAKLNWSTEPVARNGSGTGCGITFKVDDSEKDFVYMYWGVDEEFHYEGVESGRNFGTFMNSGTPLKEGSIDFTVIANGNESWFYLSFEKYGSTWSSYFLGPKELNHDGNNVGIGISNGKNYNFTNRCDWSDIFLYTW